MNWLARTMFKIVNVGRKIQLLDEGRNHTCLKYFKTCACDCVRLKLRHFLQNDISDGKNSAHFQGESNQMHMMQDEQKIMSSSFSMKPLGNFIEPPLKHHLIFPDTPIKLLSNIPETPLKLLETLLPLT